MNIRSTTPVLNRYTAVVSAVVMAITLVTGPLVQPVYADDYDQKIAQIQSQVDSYQKQVSSLRQQADSLSNAIASLQAQQNAIQAQIDLSQAKHDQLVQQIKDTEVKISKNKKALSRTISDLYVNDKVSPIEMLASSKNIGEYLDQQEYRGSIKKKVEKTIKDIKALKVSLEQKRDEAKKVLDDQQNQKKQLVAKQSEQSSLLAQTQGNEANYNNLINSSNGQIASLRAQQAAAMARSYSGNGRVYSSTAYPWPDASMAYNDNCIYSNGSSGADDWGYCKRQCVSYVAWKLNSDGMGNRGYSGLGHAISWWSAGSPVDWDNVQRGDVIVQSVGYYGHVMYVESVSGGRVHISQMNVPYDSGRASTDSYSLDTLKNGSYTARRFH